MRVLVTGARGQLGRALTAMLTGAHEVIGRGRAELDITDAGAVARALDAHAPDAVINAAAFTDVDGAESNESAAFAINARGAENVAAASARRDLPIVHISTDYVFDGTSARPYVESDAPAPRSVYGRSKLAGEDAARAANPRHHIVRTAWLYASHGRNFPRTMLALAQDPTRDEVRVVDDQRGSPTWAPHLAMKLRELIERDDWGIWHLAGSGAASWYEFACELFARSGIATRVVPVTTAEFPRPAPRPANSVLATERTRPIVLPPWKEGLAEFVRAISRESR